MSRKKKQILQKLVLNITAPIKMNQEIEFRELAVFAGQNDSGKSLMLKIAYALSMIGVGKDGPLKPIEAAQTIFDNTFTDQNFNGSLKVIYTQGSVSVDLHEGKVVSAEIEDLEDPVPIIFMSTDMRTFDQMCLYLRMRHEAGGDPILFIKKMLAAYRLYDFTYMESLIARMPITVPQIVKDGLRNSFDLKEPISTIEVDLDNCTFNAVMEDGSKRNIATYGKGHQAVLNMFLGVTA